jgi:hypothetical protein
VRRRYRPDWELLADALKRVQSTNDVTEEEAKADLCRAMGDGKIRLKIKIADGASMEGEHVLHTSPGQSLNPNEFDWQRSTALPSTISFYGFPDQPVEAMKVSTADVVEVLCGGVSAEHTPERLEQTENGQRLLAPQPTVDQRTQIMPTARSLHLSKAMAEKLVADYIEREKKAGRRPTISGLEAQRNGLRGGRESLRVAFRDIMGDEVTRGRPRKSPTKFAKK